MPPSRARPAAVGCSAATSATSAGRAAGGHAAGAAWFEQLASGWKQYRRLRVLSTMGPAVACHCRHCKEKEPPAHLWPAWWRRRPAALAAPPAAPQAPQTAARWPRPAGQKRCWRPAAAAPGDRPALARPQAAAAGRAAAATAVALPPAAAARRCRARRLAVAAAALLLVCSPCCGGVWGRQHPAPGSSTRAVVRDAPLTQAAAAPTAAEGLQPGASQPRSGGLYGSWHACPCMLAGGGAAAGPAGAVQRAGASNGPRAPGADANCGCCNSPGPSEVVTAAPRGCAVELGVGCWRCDLRPHVAVLLMCRGWAHVLLALACLLWA